MYPPWVGSAEVGYDREENVVTREVCAVKNKLPDPVVQVSRVVWRIIRKLHHRRRFVVFVVVTSSIEKTGKKAG